MRWQRWVSVASMVCLLGIAPSPVRAEASAFPVYTGDEFNQLFRDAQLANLDPIGDAPSITGSGTVDARIRSLAEERGYIRRPLASGGLKYADGVLVQPDVVSAWEALQAAARQDGHSIRMVSGYRSISTQRSGFLRNLHGYSNAEIERTLRFHAPPGYSKHHTGYAIDIAQVGSTHGRFGSTASFKWISKDNYHNAKRFGFIPSYPADASRQGPNPEPWEYTWVGVETIHCGIPKEDQGRFCDDDGSTFEVDIEWLAAQEITFGCNPPKNDRFCPNQAVTRGQAAAFLVRSFGISDHGSDGFKDDDRSIFESDINRLVAAGVTRGCNPPINDRFCPDRLMTRGEMAAFLVRVLALPLEQGDTFNDDDESPFQAEIEALFAAGITKGCADGSFCPERLVTRAELAALIRRALAV